MIFLKQVLDQCHLVAMKVILTFSLEHIKQEYPVYGSGDLRHPAIDITQENGSHILNFEYVNHQIIQGKPQLDHLPATYVEKENERQTLIILPYMMMLLIQNYS